MRFAGVVLCGGQSSRMGKPKAWLPWGSGSLLAHVVQQLAAVVAPIVVVSARDQALPELPLETLVTHDAWPGCGPLAGLEAGLSRVADVAEAAFVSSCDCPLLLPSVVETICARLGDNEVVVPEAAGFLHPLAGVYRTSLLPAIRQRLATQQLRLIDLCRVSRLVTFSEEELRAMDPELNSLLNVNEPASYERALRIFQGNSEK
jgi:molybdopterin-guanine dinucleotide biosynthesis protein A